VQAFRASYGCVATLCQGHRPSSAQPGQTTPARGAGGIVVRVGAVKRGSAGKPSMLLASIWQEDAVSCQAKFPGGGGSASNRRPLRGLTARTNSYIAQRIALKLRPCIALPTEPAQADLPCDLTYVEWMDAGRLSDGWLDFVRLQNRTPTAASRSASSDRRRLAPGMTDAPSSPPARSSDRPLPAASR
jgi:hypothetical protein